MTKETKFPNHVYLNVKKVQKNEPESRVGHNLMRPNSAPIVASANGAQITKQDDITYKEQVKMLTENTLSIHRPSWTHEDLRAYNHLHLPVRENGRVIAAIRKDHFIRTGGFASGQDRRDLE